MDSQEWHDNCVKELPHEPSRQSSKQLNAMSDQARHAYIEQLEAWLARLYLPTAAFTEIEHALDRTVQDNMLEGPGAKQIVVLTGPNYVGKSTFMLRWAQRRYLEWTQNAPQDRRGRPVHYPSDGVEADLCPVIWIDLGSAAKVNDVTTELLNGFNLASTGLTRDLTHRAMHGLRLHRTQIIVMDDAHLLKTDSKSGRDVLDHIKSINTKLGQVSSATLVLVGANLANGDLVNDPQIACRLTEFSVAPYGVDTEEEQAEWQRVVRDLERLVLPHLPAGRPGMLFLKLAGELWFRTQGYVGDLRKLVSRATVAAIADGSYRISGEHLKAITLSKRAIHETAAEAERRRTESSAQTRRRRRQSARVSDLNALDPEGRVGAASPGLRPAVGHETRDSRP